MSENAESDSRVPGLLGSLLLLLPPAVIAIHPLTNNDLPMHLAIGDWILEHGEIPSRDPFSFSAESAPWVPHEWLAGVLFAAVHQLFSSTGLQVLMVAAALLLAVVHRRVMVALGVTIPIHTAWLVPLWLMAGPRILLRPHLLVMTLPFLLWWILLRGREKPALLWLLPAVMAIWVNLHGSFLLGFGIVALDFLVGEREHRGPWYVRAGIFMTTLAALFTQVHAYAQSDFLAALLHPFQLTSDPVFMQNIQEWISPFSADAGDFRATIGFALSLPWIALALWGALSAPDRTPLSYRLFVAGLLLLYFRHQRFLGWFVLASLPLLPVFRVSGSVVFRRHAPTILALIFTLFLVYPGFPYAWNQRPQPTRTGWDFWHLPIPPVEHLVNSGFEGKVFCEYEYGGLIAWLGRGRLPISMDSRNSVYGAELYRLHHNALYVDTTLAANPALIDQPDIRAALEFRQRMLQECDAILIHSPTRDPWRQGLHNAIVTEYREEWKLEHANPMGAFLYRRVTKQ